MLQRYGDWKNFSSCRRVPTMETKNTGHWTDGNTAGCFESSYQLMPLLETLCKMAGSASVIEYRSFWSAITPPAALVKTVLDSFVQPCSDAREARTAQPFSAPSIVVCYACRDYNWPRKS